MSDAVIDVRVGDLSFRTRVAGDGELVVLLHGYPQSSSEWRAQMQALAAAGAWAVGMLPSTLIGAGMAIDLRHPGTWAALAVGGAALLLSIPVAQWTVLRGVLDRAWRWVPVNVGAWLAGLPFTFLPSPFVDEGTAPVRIAVLFALGGVTMAATVAVVTGLGLRRMLGAGPSRL